MAAGALALTLAVPGCAGDATAPDKPALSAPTRKLASALGYTEEGAISIYGPSGGVVRLDIANRTLTTPEGVTVTDIPGDEVARIASIFQHAVNDPAGQMEAALASSPPPPPPDDDDTGPGDDDGDDGGGDCGGYGCETYRVGATGGVGRTTKSARTMGPGRQLLGPRMPGGRVGFYGSPCGDIATAIYVNTQRWRNAVLQTRTRMMSLAAQASQILNRPIITYQDLIRIVGNAILLDAWMIEEWDSRIQLDILALQYGSNGCWSNRSNNWTPSDIGGVTSIGNSTTQYGWICSTKLVNDKEGWPVPVETCEYMFAA